MNIVVSLLAGIASTLSPRTKHNQAAMGNISRAFPILPSTLKSLIGHHEENGFYGESDRKNPVRSTPDIR
jgi:hypothetical protein